MTKYQCPSVVKQEGAIKKKERSLIKAVFIASFLLSVYSLERVKDIK